MELSLETLLNGDHERIDTLFERYLEKRGQNPSEAAKLFCTYQQALLKHMKCEEERIFPALERQPRDRATQEVPDMLQEHESIRECLTQIQKLCENNSNEVEAAERHLFEELHEHNAREEMHVYPHLDRILNAEEAGSVREYLSP